MVLVSVIVPTYNRPEFLPRAIETALHQSLNDLEVVVVDDGSETDYAMETVATFPDRVRCVAHSENRGLSAARNTGIDHAEGEYVAFLDDDDLWHREKLARQVDALERDGGVLATCRVASITPDGEIIRCEGSRPSGDITEEILQTNVVGSPSRVVVPVAALDSLRFDETLPTKQDWDFYIRLCRRGRVRAISEYYCFRVIHESMSSSPESAERDIAAVMERHEASIRDSGLWDAAVARYETRVGRSYLGVGDGTAARDHLSVALARNPTLKPAVLYLLTFAPTAVFALLLSVKRSVERVTRDCDGVELDHGVEID